MSSLWWHFKFWFELYMIFNSRCWTPWCLVPLNILWTQFSLSFACFIQMFCEHQAPSLVFEVNFFSLFVQIVLKSLRSSWTEDSFYNIQFINPELTTPWCKLNGLYVHHITIREKWWVIHLKLGEQRLFNHDDGFNKTFSIVFWRG